MAEAAQARERDEFGMDLRYIARWRAIFDFLCDRYWRIEVQGMEHVPSHGAVVLAGTHRGFMPWDAVMALRLLMRERGRIPRFLTHPGLLKFGPIRTFVTKLGGIPACRENADRVLESGELLGMYPEGVQGAFSRYREAYQVRGFAREFVKLALRHRVPIIPFVNVGSAEAYPVFAQLKFLPWMRFSDWPCLPVSTFPFLPFPFPSKWHIQFLPPIHLEQQYGPEAADDDSVVRKITQEIRSQMQQAMDDILRRRRSIFWGSVFPPQPAKTERAGDPI